MTDANAIDQFGQQLQGKLVRPGDAEYDEARRVWNGMIDKRPAMIARCAGTGDVVAAVNFARENGLVIAVRGGGHNVAGHATCDDGVVIDLSPMKNVTVDASRKTALAECGATWRDYDAATQKHGLASPGGAISTTGIAGLTLGGGFGWISRSYGLACDNVISAEVVTANGEVLEASAEENADLFWAIRGGGGNFGVVTRFEYRLQKIGELYAGMLLYPREMAGEFMRVWADWTAGAPDAVSSMAAFLHTPDGIPVVGAFIVYNGPADEGETVIAPLRAVGAPALDDVNLKPYTALQQALDDGFPRGMRNYWKATYLADVGEECRDVLIEHANNAPTPVSVVGLEHMLGGAVARVDKNENAFAARDAIYNLLILGRTDNAAGDDAVRDWVRGLWKAVDPYSTGGAYVNYMSADEADRVGEAFGASHARLVQIKSKYDPENFFRLNQNIAPV
ncbi:MAG: FAD-binding oxidoreductase [Acidobacteriota bacterium]|nr:FAD-binding oxidoreductase [Acidobacteriota bacterium]